MIENEGGAKMNGNVKWDKDQVVSIMKARMDGKTLQQIADEYGCTRENIRQIIGRGVRIIQKGDGHKRNEGIIYPNIAMYLDQNDENIRHLSKATGIIYNTLLNYLRHNRDMPLSVALIIAGHIGMTVEEAFALPEGVKRPKRIKRGAVDEYGD